ncbi:MULTISPECIES: hypothetical protein [unclassified Delftia]|uniref:hypothetical protein n=1 Tax=Delftia TaxID=80865 RepID=UPI0018FFDC43|nr:MULTISPECIES: hypothetical protein [unclassified Delftia]MBK0115776.1 hypothetical protein [Delftia sp. S65]MBK0121642.1 hypothetical protein [Delftia sp. S67]MBK0131581.1 hypothetical protein [Delftia sp. S66]
MNKEYYIMAINEEFGCPAGFYHSVLAKDFEEVKADYGYNPWYAGPKRYGGTLPSLPEKLILMEKNEYNYDVRKGADYFYVISAGFARCLPEIKHNFSEIKRVDCVDSKGIARNTRDVFIAIPKKFKAENCLDISKSKQISPRGVEYESLHFKEELDFDIFDIVNISSSQASLICSEKAKKIFEDHGIRCVKYIPISDINASMQSHMSELYKPVGFYDPV